MSLVDRWLSRPARHERVATFATSATFQETPSVSADFDVATGLRHAATLPLVPTPSPPMSQPVADELRHENPQNSAGFTPMSQMSQMSQEGTSEAWGEAERTAIGAQDATIPREWAEGFARLDPCQPPGEVPPRRWRSICDAIGAFLDCWGAEAARLGWTAHDLFGADGERPEVTWLNSGPLWLGDGARVVELDADRIVFETRAGARQTASRRPPLRPRVLPWEI